MICKVCGREIANENANFCEYCGTSVRDGSIMPVSEEPVRVEYAAPQGNRSLNQADEMRYGGPAGMFAGAKAKTDADAEKEPTIPFGNWLITLLLPLIPMVGPLVYIVMLFVWAFGKAGSKTKRNWSRAQLIMLIVSLFMMGAVLGPMLSELMGGAAGAGMF